MHTDASKRPTDTWTPPNRRRSGGFAALAAEVRQQNAIFRAVGAKALRRADDVLQRLLPDGVFEGCEYVARNPKRADRHLGSFRINLDTGA